MMRRRRAGRQERDPFHVGMVEDEFLKRLIRPFVMRIKEGQTHGQGMLGDGLCRRAKISRGRQVPTLGPKGLGAHPRDIFRGEQQRVPDGTRI
ncbi:MAG: hypothetical protein M0T84_11295 [Betaproteobacteria bacterium]|nr:hypothetical protein [Betaproteobacteria bacterium]